MIRILADCSSSRASKKHYGMSDFISLIKHQYVKRHIFSNLLVLVISRDLDFIEIGRSKIFIIVARNLTLKKPSIWTLISLSFGDLMIRNILTFN